MTSPIFLSDSVLQTANSEIFTYILATVFVELCGGQYLDLKCRL